MLASEAARLVNRTTFRPGWRFFADSIGDGSIVVSFETVTCDSSYPDYAGRYLRRVLLGDTWTFDVSGMTTHEQLLFAILGRIHREWDVHEDREFLRVLQPDGSWYAPLHPHHEAGKRAWAALEAESAPVPA
jgi:hypothetical protein